MNRLIFLAVIYLVRKCFTNLVIESCVIGIYSVTEECTKLIPNVPSNGHCECINGNNENCAGENEVTKCTSKMKGCPLVCVCIDNYIWKGNTCIKVDGTGDEGGDDGGETKTCECPAGSVCTGGVPECSPCEPGSVPNAEKSLCILCEAETYAVEGECKPCSRPKFNYGKGNTECCELGQYMEGKKCKDCKAGNYVSEISGQYQCNPCDSGSYSNEDKSVACTKCDVDHFQDLAGQTQCRPCVDGTYQSEKGQAICLKCHDFCTKCSRAKDNCSSCINNPGIELVGNKCLCKTKAGFYVHMEGTELRCDPCYEFCKVCEKNAKYCLSCLPIPGVNKVTNQCLCNGRGYGFENNGESNPDRCFPCHPLCDSCYESNFDTCFSCNADRGAVLVAVDTCQCPSRYYYDSYEESCFSCHPLCETCFGPSAYECDSCFGSFSVEGKTWCVYSCEPLSGYLTVGNTCKRKSSQ